VLKARVVFDFILSLVWPLSYLYESSALRKTLFNPISASSWPEFLLGSVLAGILLGIGWSVGNNLVSRFWFDITGLKDRSGNLRPHVIVENSASPCRDSLRSSISLYR
jgi:hypothetical protein